MTALVYLNGRLVPPDEARVSVFDQGFLYGYGLFETMRAYGGKIFRLESHLARLAAAAGAIGLEGVPGGAELARACADTLRADDLKEARLRLTVSRGAVAGFPGEAGGVPPTVVVTAGLYTPLPPETCRRGYRACIASWRRGRSLAGVKSTSYLGSVLARREAGAAGYDEALLLNEAGLIAEGSASNIFFAGSGGLVTPSLDGGALPGVTRAVVTELAGALGIKVTEADVRPGEIGQFSEAFLTNSVMEIMPLVAVRDEGGKDVAVGAGQPGAVTRQLMAAYKEMVGRETG